MTEIIDNRAVDHHVQAMSPRAARIQCLPRAAAVGDARSHTRRCGSTRIRSQEKSRSHALMSEMSESRGAAHPLGETAKTWARTDLQQAKKSVRASCLIERQTSEASRKEKVAASQPASGRDPRFYSLSKRNQQFAARRRLRAAVPAEIAGIAVIAKGQEKWASVGTHVLAGANRPNRRNSPASPSRRANPCGETPKCRQGFPVPKTCL